MTTEDSPANRTLVELARQRREAGIELLARLAIRLPSAVATQLLACAPRLYQSPVIRASLTRMRLGDFRILHGRLGCGRAGVGS